MDSVSYIWGGIKPERKCVGFRFMLGLLFGDYPNVVGLNQCIDELVSVWFYFTFIFIIEFVLMVFDTKFVSDGL